jgi:hypothetical protein
MPQKLQRNCMFMNSASVFIYARRSTEADDGFVRSLRIRDMICLLLFIILTGLNMDEGIEKDNTWGGGGLPTLPCL